MKKIDIGIAALQFFCLGVSINTISEALGLTYIQTEKIIRDRINYLHSEKP